MHYKCLRGREPSYDEVDQECSKLITLEQRKYIEKCLILARKSNLTQKHGCVLVKNKRIISSGYNFKIQEAFIQKQDNIAKKTIFSVHAEISTIKKVKNQNLSECDMYIVRLGPESQTCNHVKYSHPCKVCHSYIQKFNIRKVYYSVNSDISL